MKQKIDICAPSHKFVGLYIRNWGIYRQSEKNLLNSSIFSTCPHNMVNFGSLTADIGWRVWSTQQISTSFMYWLPYCSDVTQRRSTKLCTMFGRLLVWYTIHTFSGLLSLNGILLSAKFTLRLSLSFSSIGSVTTRHTSIRRQPNCGVVEGMNYGTFAFLHFRSRERIPLTEFRQLENSLQVKKN